MFDSAALLATRRVTKLQSKVRQLIAAAACLDELLMSGSEDSKQKICSESNTRCRSENTPLCEAGSMCKNDTQTQSYSGDPWFLIHQNQFHTAWQNTLKQTIHSGGVSEGLMEMLRHLSDYVKRNNRLLRRGRLVAMDTFYRRVTSGIGVDYVAFVRDVSSHVWPYVVRQTFDDVVVITKKQ